MLLGRRLAAMTELLKSVDYEVFGTVQGVCFRMYTEGEAKKRGLVGWVKNTSKGTVTGQVQGPEEKVDAIGATPRRSGSHTQDQFSGPKVTQEEGPPLKPPDSKRTRLFTFNVPGSGNTYPKDMESLLLLMKMVIYSIDKAKKFRLNRGGRQKAGSPG